MLTALGARFLSTINPVSTSVLFEDAMKYLTVGTGLRPPSSQDYALELPILNFVGSSCGSYCGQQGTVFEEDALNKTLTAKSTIVRVWKNTMSAVVQLSEYGLSPNYVGYPLAVRELFRDESGAPAPLLVQPGATLPVKYTLSVTLRPWGLVQRPLYADGVQVQAFISYFAATSALRRELFVSPVLAGNVRLYYSNNPPPNVTFPLTSFPLPSTYISPPPSDLAPPLIGTAYFWGANFDVGAVVPVRYVVLTWGNSVSGSNAQYGLFIDFGQSVSFRNSYMAFGAITQYGQEAIGW